ncbi:MAG: anaerobic ribonucleoside-triphosphate reductase activating protein [Alphaproteobacteria bacterium]|nr:anaerobic ribonucleoside-triphosphate reductase activating protein [Alphaproteobacteria bacterium]MBQ3514430.1 anaerobic ribonucleoside-triphosphate reductase activating protein [Lachnospiraceae bacterium]
MRYNQIRECDIANGEGIGVALFVQGCHFKCKNCFNPETWDFNGGKEWTEEIENKFIELASRPYIKRISLLGGECLADENLDGILNLVHKIRLLFGQNKTIWLYTGYKWEDIWFDSKIIIDDFTNQIYENYKKRQQILSMCNVAIDGRYIDSQRDVSLCWRGSKNQRAIDVQESLQQNKVVLYCD